MKPQNLSSESSSVHESKRAIGEKFWQICEAARVVVAGSHGTSREKGNGNPCISFFREMERRNENRTYRVEDPIRTLMFLGSWSHT
ncbi:Histidine--tRNA ligase [Actinidia chinensis var. chinensis]|uniref:Histidine--tRNA ligase n=1 Tax=Actinidia chinensis var. chinensis TaxID=1590841 RepID=A0A2R6QU77_ACTCC|nr:Histidine--tRNA ligase [Actinidia chinensis var. chinensis]